MGDRKIRYILLIAPIFSRKYKAKSSVGVRKKKQCLGIGVEKRNCEMSSRENEGKFNRKVK